MSLLPNADSLVFIFYHEKQDFVKCCDRLRQDSQKKRAIRMHNNNELKLTKAMIADTSKQIRELRKKIKLADEVVTDMSKVYTRLNVPDKNPEIINKKQKGR